MKAVKIFKQLKTLDKLPGPQRKLYPVGNFNDIKAYLGKGGLMTFTMDMAKKYGNIVRYWLGPLSFVQVSDPKLVKEFIRDDPDFFIKGEIYKNLEPWFGNSILISEGDVWRKKRASMNKAFDLKSLKGFVETFKFSTERVFTLFDKNLEKSSDNNIYDIGDVMTSLTQDVIGLSAFGYDFQTIESEINQDSEKNEITKAYETITECLTQRQNSFSNFLPNNIYEKTQFGKKWIDAINKVGSTCENIIQERIDNKDLKLERDDLLSLMMKYQESKQYNVKELINEVQLFLFAGHETTSVTLTFALDEINKNPEVKQRVLEEIDQHIGINCDLSKIDYSRLSKLKYCANVVKETLRMHSPTVGFSRTNTQLMDIGGYEIPPESNVFVASRVMHYDPENYPNPEKFDPDRWLPKNSKGRHPLSFAPFALGARNCIGSAFALLEARTVLALLLSRYDFETITPAEYEFKVLLRPKNCQMKVSKRLIE